MLRISFLHFIIFLVLVDTALSLFENQTLHDNIKDKPKNLDTRRRNTKKKRDSTSSSSRDRKDDTGGESLDLSSSDSSTASSEEDKKYGKPNSSLERKGWRKWHRKCTPCPEDMKKKWRDPSIQWICGGYQRARRSFKSTCMMYYRNCQDGTMFVKIHDHQCSDDPRSRVTHGDHFFYEYKVALSAETSATSSQETDSVSTS